MLKDDLAKYLTFNTRSQAVKIHNDAPKSVKEYSDHNGHLDCKKMFNKFLENVRYVVQEFGEDDQLLADMKIVGLTTEWTPCTGKYLL